MALRREIDSLCSYCSSDDGKCKIVMPDHNETDLSGNAANIEQLFRYGDAGSYAGSPTRYFIIVLSAYVFRTCL